MKTITSAVAFQDPQGNVVASGSLVLDLSQAAEVTSGGGQVAPKRVAITLTAGGLIPNGTQIFANDELTPTGTTYHARMLDSNTNQIADFGQWSIAGSSPIDLSGVVPTTTGASYPAAVLQTPAAQQTINGQPLVLEGANLGFSAAGSTIGTAWLSRTANGTLAVGNTSGAADGTINTTTYQVAGTAPTGSGALVQATSPTLVTPNIGAATATSVNKVAITAPATSATLTIANGKTLTVNNTLALSGTDSTTQTFPASPPTNGVLSYGNPKFQQFTSSGTFTIPTGVTAVKATVIGGGGGGAATNNVNSGAGGASAGLAIKWLTGVTPGNTITVTVGALGAGGLAGANNGSVGGNSSISSGTQTITTVTANGGNGGGFNSFGGAGGTATNGDVNCTGNTGGFPVNATTGGGIGAAGFLLGSGQLGFSGAGGNASSFGAGGGGAGSGAGSLAGGNGSPGIVIFEWTS